MYAKQTGATIVSPLWTSPPGHFPPNPCISECVCVCVLGGGRVRGRNRIFEHTAPSRVPRRRNNASGTPVDALIFYNNIRDLITVVCFLARSSFGPGVGGFPPLPRIPRDPLAFSAGPLPYHYSPLNRRQSRRPTLHVLYTYMPRQSILVEFADAKCSARLRIVTLYAHNTVGI